jgi:hypothetical protein
MTGKSRQQPGEQELLRYCKVARFSSDQACARVYRQARDSIFASSGCAVSAYRFLVDAARYVQVLAEPPSADFERQ